jgi:hypothetical protein
MKAVIKCRLQSGEEVEYTAIDFKWQSFEGVQIVGGDKYYIDKAVELGATDNTKPKRTKKAPK